MSIASNGYGKVQIQGVTYLAHRVSAWAFGILDDISNGNLVIRHQKEICRSKACVNPEHLQVGDSMDNFLDTILYNEGNAAAQNFGKQVCANGHPFDEENTLVSVRRGGHLRRSCKACARDRMRVRRGTKEENFLRKD
jgi:hypothetical protein